MRLAVLPTVVTAALAGTVAAGAEKVAPIEGYGVEEIQWNLEVAPGRLERLNGTAQEVIALAQQINPDFVVPQADPHPHPHPHPQEATAIQQRPATAAAVAGTGNNGNSTAVLAKRNQFLCDIFGEPKADIAFVYRDIDYLRGLKGGPTQGPGPSNCGRVSCERGASIWICNDAPYTHYFDSWHWIADSASAIVQKCYRQPYMMDFKTLSDGQVFEDGDWNVIVRWDIC